LKFNPKGLKENSRWSQQSEDHRKGGPPNITTLKGWKILGRFWHPFRVRSSLLSKTGGLRFAATTGYFLAAPSGCHSLLFSWCLLVVDAASIRSPRVSKGYFGNWLSLTVGLLTRSATSLVWSLVITAAGKLCAKMKEAETKAAKPGLALTWQSSRPRLAELGT